MVDFLNYDGLSYIDICKKLLKLMEKIARYKHHIVLLICIFASMQNQEDFS